MGEMPPLPGNAERWALFLDVDGTLAPIAATPAFVSIAPQLLPLLERLRRGCGGALALVSGRRLADIDALFAPLRLPAGALHGAERRRDDGSLSRSEPPAEDLETLRPRLAAYAAARPGLVLEDKGASLALHYRLAPRYGTEISAFARRLAAGLPHLRLIEGRKIVEFAPRGSDKGRAIGAFMREAPFQGRRPVFAGDDTTDEDGFAAVNDAAGYSIKVISSETEARTQSRAQFTVPSVEALHHWLGAVADRFDDAVAAAEKVERPLSGVR